MALHVPTRIVSYCLDHYVGKSPKAEIGSVENNIMIN